MPETLLPLHRLSNQMSFKWNSVRVTDKIFFFFFITGTQDTITFHPGTIVL